MNPFGSALIIMSILNDTYFLRIMLTAWSTYTSGGLDISLTYSTRVQLDRPNRHAYTRYRLQNIAG